jgi:hypothetical protein
VQMPEPYAHLTVDAWGQSREQWGARKSAGAPV